MSNTAVSSLPALAWSEGGAPFAPPAAAIAWRVFERRANSHQRRPVWTTRGILHLRLDATMDHLRAGVGNRPARYELVPVDAIGAMLEPVAVAVVVPDPAQQLAAEVARALGILVAAALAKRGLIIQRSNPPQSKAHERLPDGSSAATVPVRCSCRARSARRWRR